MKQHWGSCKSHITKGVVKAQEHCSATTPYLVAYLQSRRRQEAVIPISCPCHPGDDGTTEVWRKTRFSHVWIYSLSQGRLNPQWPRSRLLLRADERRLQSYRNHICMNVNPDRDKAAVVETHMTGLLVSGLIWLKVKQRKRVFPNSVIIRLLDFLCVYTQTTFVLLSNKNKQILTVHY